MPTLAVSSHGTIVAVQLPPGPGPAYTDIAEQGDATPPQLMRNEFDATTQEKDIDSYVLGVMRRNAFALNLHFLPEDPTQDHLTGLYKLIIEIPLPDSGSRIHRRRAASSGCSADRCRIWSLPHQSMASWR